MRRLAVDFDKEDGKIDIINSVQDAVGSIGNFLRYHGWVPNELVIITVPKSNHLNTNNIELNPSRTNITLSELIPNWQKIKNIFIQ